jgi:hypothetical protein
MMHQGLSIFLKRALFFIIRTTTFLFSLPDKGSPGIPHSEEGPQLYGQDDKKKATLF